jgi:hypothetical protein
MILIGILKKFNLILDLKVKFLGNLKILIMKQKMLIIIKRYYNEFFGALRLFK